MYAPPSPSVGASRRGLWDRLHLRGPWAEGGAYEMLGGPRRSVALEQPPDVPWGLGEQSWGAGSKTAWLPKLSSGLVLRDPPAPREGSSPRRSVRAPQRGFPPTLPKELFPEPLSTRFAPLEPMPDEQAITNECPLLSPPSPSLLSLSFRRGFLPLPPLPRVDLPSLRKPPLVRFPGVGLARTPQSGVTVSSA